MDNHPIPETQNVEPNKTLLDNEIPDKFKDPETGDVRTDALLKSYKSLEKKLSSQKNRQNPIRNIALIVRTGFLHRMMKSTNVYMRAA